MTQKRRFRVLTVGQRPTSTICEHCWRVLQLTVEGDAQHLINECKRQYLMAIRSKRHDEALRAIHVAVARGAHSDCYLQTDLPSTSGIVRLWFMLRAEKRQVLPQVVETDYRQRSRPDLLMIPGRSCSGKRTRHGAAQCCQVAHVVELKFTSDDQVHGAAFKEALTQHAALASRLESRGFTVQVMPIIGSSGMIRAETQNHFATLGLTAPDCLSLMQEHRDTAITSRDTGNVDSYKYLGVTFKSTGNPAYYMPSARHKITASYHAMRENYCILACGTNARLQLSFFAATVTSIALYGGEVWGVHPRARTERKKTARLHNKYLRQLLNVVNMARQSALSPVSREARQRLSATIRLSATSEFALNLICK